MPLPSLCSFPLRRCSVGVWEWERFPGRMGSLFAAVSSVPAWKVSPGLLVGCWALNKTIVSVGSPCLPQKREVDGLPDLCCRPKTCLLTRGPGWFPRWRATITFCRTTWSPVYVSTFPPDLRLHFACWPTSPSLVPVPPHFPRSLGIDRSDVPRMSCVPTSGTAG